MIFVGKHAHQIYMKSIHLFSEVLKILSNEMEFSFNTKLHNDHLKKWPFCCEMKIILAKFLKIYKILFEWIFVDQTLINNFTSNIYILQKDTSPVQYLVTSGKLRLNMQYICLPPHWPTDCDLGNINVPEHLPEFFS